MRGAGNKCNEGSGAQSDAKGFQAKTTRIGAAQAEIEAAETEWLELEMLREELSS